MFISLKKAAMTTAAVVTAAGNVRYVSYIRKLSLHMNDYHIISFHTYIMTIIQQYGSAHIVDAHDHPRRGTTPADLLHGNGVRLESTRKQSHLLAVKTRTITAHLSYSTQYTDMRGVLPSSA